MGYEIIVLDLDGTLTNDEKIITPKTKEALMEMQRRGKRVVLASGRPTQGVSHLTNELELNRYEGYVLSYNGGMIIDWKTGETIFSRLLPLESNRRIIELAAENGVNILTYEGDHIITATPEDQYAQLESRVNHMEIRQVEDMAGHMDFQVPKYLMLADGDYMASVEPKVQEALGEGFSVYRSAPFFLEILPMGIDKAKSLARMLEVLGLTRENMIACGDGYNDLSMIQYAGLGVAMANAVPPVLEAADFVTKSNNEDGIAHVIEKFILS